MGKPLRFSREFKEEAVRLAQSQDVPIKQVAKELGVPYWTLQYWLKQAKKNDRKKPGALPVEEENRQLREEVRRLRLEREILKKATAFFAREPE
jgi:transposase